MDINKIIIGLTNIFINKIIFKIFVPLAGSLDLGAFGTGASPKGGPNVVIMGSP